MTHKDTKENECSKRLKNKITGEEAHQRATTSETSAVATSSSTVISSTTSTTSTSTSTPTPSTTTPKPFHRCVSICSDDINNGNIGMGIDMSMLKENNTNTNHNSNEVNSSLSPNTMNRKRPRPESFVDGEIQKPLLFSPLQNKKRVSVLLSKEKKCIEYPKVKDGHQRQRQHQHQHNVKIPSLPSRSLQFPLPCKIEEHILLNDNSLQKGLATPFSLPSPVRSVVSCDASQVDMELERPEVTIGLNEPSDMECSIPPTTCKPCNDTTNLDNLPESLKLHINALQIEASLAPMKPLLSRLMVHPTHNRKGAFNSPVDYKALGLKNYLTIVKKPMDLGTVKTNLHSNIYPSHEVAAADIRLCFENAILFNPALHPIHEAAKHLLLFFESSYAKILQKKSEQNDNVSSLSNTTSLPMPHHTCQSCCGRKCKICNEGCLSLEPTLVICAGAQCAGSKIRRGIVYYCSTDGAKAWCQKCYTTLPAILPTDNNEANDIVQYKRDLLKRRNDEDIVERWFTCCKCGDGVHESCAFVDEFTIDESAFECPLCLKSVLPASMTKDAELKETEKDAHIDGVDVYSYISGHALPAKNKHAFEGSSLDCRTLPSCSIAKFVESKIKERMIALKCPANAEKTLTVRVISNCEKVFQIPSVVQRHFRKTNSHAVNSVTMKGVTEYDEIASEVAYKSKAIALFQRIDGMDVCIFCMYVQEYGGTEENYESLNDNDKRIYIAYIDSVEHFRPRELRTNIYHEILVAYLATARARGYRHAHIWSCPPSRGNSFIFWGHPASQRTPTKERLLSWYHTAISYGLNRGVITDVKSLYEYSFKEYEQKRNGSNDVEGWKDQSVMVCPPLLEGDFWVEEAMRVHSNSIPKFHRTKNFKTYSPHEYFCSEKLFSDIHSNCPAMHVATVLQDDIMLHPSAVAFCRPVNAVALKLLDYHEIIKKPMDLGTVTMQCLLGEYDNFAQVVDDIELIFNNAMRYNPPGHIIHSLASDLLAYSKKQLSTLVSYWEDRGVEKNSGSNSKKTKIENFSMLSMKLGASISSKQSTPSPRDNFKPLNESSSYSTSSRKINLLTGGPKAVAESMAGEDTWLLDKRHLHKPTGKKKPKKEKIKYNVADGMFKKQESWLGDDLSTIVRRLRTDCFVCNLYQDDKTSVPSQVKDEEFESYISGFNATPYHSTNIKGKVHTQPGVIDTRQGLLEFSQYRNFQFDTTRRAKYSTAMLLLYLRRNDNHGIIPKCTQCQSKISVVRWRKVNKAFDERRRSSTTLAVRMASVDMSREELCSPCYELLKSKDSHVPIRVTFRSTSS